jgi:hypothetical protein
MDVAEVKESQCPAEPELTFQRNKCGWQRKERLGWQYGKKQRPKARRAWTTAGMTAAVPGWHPKAEGKEADQLQNGSNHQ